MSIDNRERREKKEKKKGKKYFLSFKISEISSFQNKKTILPIFPGPYFVLRKKKKNY